MTSHARSLLTIRSQMTCLGVAAIVALDASAARAEDFRAFTWRPSDPADTPNLSPMVWVARDSDLGFVATQVKSLPTGSRYLLMFEFINDLATNPFDRCAPGMANASSAPLATGASVPKIGIAPQSGGGPLVGVVVPIGLTTQRGPWIDAGIGAVQARMNALVTTLAALGVEVDGFVFDNETTLHASRFLPVPSAFSTIQADPRWMGLAVQLGLPFDISSPQAMYWGSTIYYRWAEVMAGRFDNAMNTAVYTPIRSAYPQATASNYNSAAVTAGHETPDITAMLDRYATTGFGTHDTFSFYGHLTPLRIAASTGLALPMAGNAWVALRLEVHKVRGLFASNGSRPKFAWIAPRSYTGNPGSAVFVGFAGTPYWDEMVLQLGMSGISTFLNWSPDDPPNRRIHSSDQYQDQVALDGLLSELDAMVGQSPATRLALNQPTWSDRVLASARLVGSDMLWRFSFDAGIESVDVRFTDGTTATVVREQGRAGGWLRYPVSKKIVMDRRGALPMLTLHP